MMSSIGFPADVQGFVPGSEAKLRSTFWECLTSIFCVSLILVTIACFHPGFLDLEETRQVTPQFSSVRYSV